MDWSTQKLTALDGQPFDTATLTGKVVLVVNVASKCGLTPQYKGLQSLFESQKEDGLVVLGVPCNQFLGQEPGNASEIESFCTAHYGVTFPMLQKQQVNGSGRSDLYATLVDSAPGGGKPIKWNFEKFLIGRDGTILRRFDPKTVPSDPDIIESIKSAL